MNRYRNLAVLAFLACVPLAYALIGSESEVFVGNSYDSVQGYKVKGVTVVDGTGAITGSISGNAATATALSANQGTTTTVLHGNAAGTPAFSAVVLTTDVSGTLPLAKGGGLTTATDDSIAVGNGTILQSKAIPDCVDSGGNHLNYTAATNTFSCGTS